MAERPELLEEEVVSRIVEEVLERFRYHGHRTWGDKSIIPYTRIEFVEPYSGALTAVAWVVGTAGRCFLQPLIIEYPRTIDGVIVDIQNVCAGNHRVGIYRDNGDTPVGGALVAQSGSVAKAGVWTTALIPLAAALARGLYWIGIMSDEVLTEYTRLNNSWNAAVLPRCYYDQAYGAFANPCPAITVIGSMPNLATRVASVQPL